MLLRISPEAAPHLSFAIVLDLLYILFYFSLLKKKFSTFVGPIGLSYFSRFRKEYAHTGMLVSLFRFLRQFQVPVATCAMMSQMPAAGNQMYPIIRGLYDWPYTGF